MEFFSLYNFGKEFVETLEPAGVSEGPVLFQSVFFSGFDFRKPHLLCGVTKTSPSEVNYLQRPMERYKLGDECWAGMGK